jgi:hypothetical protein
MIFLKIVLKGLGEMVNYTNKIINLFLKCLKGGNGGKGGSKKLFF